MKQTGKKMSRKDNKRRGIKKIKKIRSDVAYTFSKIIVYRKASRRNKTVSQARS